MGVDLADERLFQVLTLRPALLDEYRFADRGGDVLAPPEQLQRRCRRAPERGERRPQVVQRREGSIVGAVARVVSRNGETA